MITFLFEQYGYYPSNLKENSFDIGNWCFKLIEVDCTSEHVDKIEEYLSLISVSFNNKVAFIIKNRKNEKITTYDGKKYVLISVNKDDVTIETLNQFHFILKENKFVDLKEVLLSWEEKMSFIENEAITSLRLDSVYYGSNMEICMYCLGLCQNAIQYLSDTIIDYNGKIENVTITHKRLHSLNSIEIFNPFNFIVDHPIRDLIELYKNDVINYQQVVNLFGYYDIDSKVASFALARLLCPTNFFDQIEENFYKSDKNMKIEYNIEKELLKLKKMYMYLKEKYYIRPISWLEIN